MYLFLGWVRTLLLDQPPESEICVLFWVEWSPRCFRKNSMARHFPFLGNANQRDQRKSCLMYMWWTGLFSKPGSSVFVCWAISTCPSHFQVICAEGSTTKKLAGLDFCSVALSRDSWVITLSPFLWPRGLSSIPWLPCYAIKREPWLVVGATKQNRGLGVLWMYILYSHDSYM